MNIATIGLDLAKNVFQVHGVDEQGRAILRKTVKRAYSAHAGRLFHVMPVARSAACRSVSRRDVMLVGECSRQAAPLATAALSGTAAPLRFRIDPPLRRSR